jgi:hypothetical protein
VQAQPNSGAFRMQGGSGQHPPVQTARPGPPVPPQVSGGHPVPPRIHTTGSMTGGVGPVPGMARPMPGPMPQAPVSRPMPSMPLVAPMAPRMPGDLLLQPRDTASESPNWIRLIITLVLLMILTIGGYMGFVRYMQDTAAKTASKKPVSYQPKGTPLFSDSFTSNTFGWNLQADEKNFAVTVGGSMLTLECNTNKLLWELVPGTRTYSNFQVAFDAKLSEGDQNNGYGVYVRGTSNADSDLATYYRFELYGDGSYAVFKGSLDSAGKSFETKLLGYTGNSAINKAGKVNHVLVIGDGSKLTFLVNGQVLKSFTDSSYSSGTIALFVSNLPQAKPGAQVQFSHFAIYPYPSTK